MTLSFAELVEQPAGSLVYTTSDGSITFDENLAGMHHHLVYGYEQTPLDKAMFQQERSRYKVYFDEWGKKKQTEPFNTMVYNNQATTPLGLLLSSIYVYVVDEFDHGTSSAFVEMFIDGKVQFVKFNVHNFFTRRRMNVVRPDPDIAAGNYQGRMNYQMRITSDPLDNVKDFELFKTSRLLLQ